MGSVGTVLPALGVDGGVRGTLLVKSVMEGIQILSLGISMYKIMIILLFFAILPPLLGR